MAETKEITRLYVVTDSETSYDNIGDIDGGMFDEQWLKEHIKSHGTGNLLERLSYMIRQVIDVSLGVNREISEQNNKDMVKPVNDRYEEEVKLYQKEMDSKKFIDTMKPLEPILAEPVIQR